ncbi:MAG: conjugative transfer signal peptidase TraF [Burkholderiales bacterium]|jgi:conjugal transfer pilin signal peptidase TrbI|nr:conjugative transfer signal peptidase TraF [Burkholderiales bacterium]
MSTASTVVTCRLSVWAWWRHGVRLLSADMRHRWYLFAALALIWALALFRLFVHHMPLIPVMFNWTPSIPYRVVYVDYGSRSIQRGDLIVYTFTGQAGEKDYPGLKAQPFFKRVVGLPGDEVTVVGRDVFVNKVFVGRAKTHTFDRRPIEPISPTVIPPGHLYVQGTSVDSFDSRYRSSGLVPLRDIEAKVRPIF